jgi:hypothetical protein
MILLGQPVVINGIQYTAVNSSECTGCVERDRTKNELTRRIQETASVKLFLVIVMCRGCNL